MGSSPLPGTMQLAEPLIAVPAPGAHMTRRELAWVALGFAFAITIFLGPAIFTGRFLSSWDLSYSSYPWHAQPPAGWARPSNSTQFDSVLQFEPWLAYSAARLHAGSLPLWNPQNGLGVPFLANMQSALFYPGNWLYFLFPSGFLLVARVWLNMLAAALGMYLLARSVARVRPVSAVLAATMFTFGGFVTSWALWPHMNVAVWLPWLWWATARLIDAPGPARLAALSGFVALSVLGGQPEITYYTALASGLFALFRIATGGALKARRVASLLALWVGGYALGTLISAVQLLPFLDYLSQSVSLTTRVEQGGHRLWLPLPYLWTAVAPDLLGNPARGTVWSPVIINYHVTNLYTGVLGLLLAPLSALVRGQRRLVLFLALFLLVCLAIVYHAPLIYDSLTSVVPLMNLAPNYRLQLVINLTVALLAALGLEAFVSELARPRRVLSLLAGAVLVVAVAGIVVPWVFASDWFDIPSAPLEALVTWREALVRAAIALAICAALPVAVVVLARRRPGWSPALVALVPLTLWLDLAQARIDFNPTMAPGDYAPATAATDFLKAHAGSSRVVALGSAFTPNSNMYYGLSDLRSYDAMEPQTYRDLTVQIDPGLATLPGGLITMFKSVHSPVVNLLGVRYVMSEPGDDPNLSLGAHQDLSTTPVGEIIGNKQAGQTFVADADNLSQIQVLGATYGRRLTGTLFFHLKEAPDAPGDLVTQEVSLDGLADDTWWKITFPPVRQSAGRSFYFYLESKNIVAGQAPTLWYHPDEQYSGGTRMEDGRPAQGDLAFRTFSFVGPDAPRFTRVLDGGTRAASIFENRAALPRAWLAHNALVIPDKESRLGRLADPTFPATTTVLLASSLLANQALPGSFPPLGTDSVNITRYEPEAVEITTDSPAAGVLVLSDQYLSGWQATVDDAPATMLPIDQALRGVYLPAGSHKVRFSYAPLSFEVGAALSATALAATFALLVLSRRRKAARSAGV